LEVERTDLRPENEYLRQQCEISQKLWAPSRAFVQRFERIEAMNIRHLRRRLCEALEVAASSRCDWGNAWVNPVHAPAKMPAWHY